jgi:hypothetical protein
MERMEKQLTAVEWLVEKHVNQCGVLLLKDIEQAKQMEKEQIGKFYNHGQWTTVHGDTFEDYYNRTFKSE